MTASQELREWAMYSRQTARRAYPLPWRADRYRFTSDMLVALKPDDRRTFALLVACALEDED